MTLFVPREIENRISERIAAGSVLQIRSDAVRGINPFTGEVVAINAARRARPFATGNGVKLLTSEADCDFCNGRTLLRLFGICGDAIVLPERRRRTFSFG